MNRHAKGVVKTSRLAGNLPLLNPAICFSTSGATFPLGPIKAEEEALEEALDLCSEEELDELDADVVAQERELTLPSDSVIILIGRDAEVFFSPCCGCCWPMLWLWP